MTPNEALLRLKALRKEHQEGDQILCDLLITLGYQEVVDAWRKIEKWYA